MNSGVILPQQDQGKSNIISSSNITIWNTISSAGQSKSFEIQASLSTVILTNKEHIFHSATNILRKEIELNSFTDFHCRIANFLSIASSFFKLVYAFVFIVIHFMVIGWYCTQPSLFSGKRTKHNCLNSWLEPISSVSKNSLYPFHLESAKQMFHWFGKKDFMETPLQQILLTKK